MIAQKANHLKYYSKTKEHENSTWDIRVQYFWNYTTKNLLENNDHLLLDVWD